MGTADRSRSIEAHLPLVRALAARYARRGEPFDDLVQVGVIGLIHAVDRFDPARGHSFEAYAIPTITGEIRRHLRDACAAIRVPRRAFEEHARVRRAAIDLEARTGRRPTAREIAVAAGVSLATVDGMLRVPQVEPLEDGHDRRAQSDPIAALDDRIAVATALRALPPRERLVLLLTFYGDRSQRRIADELGLSQIHVSRLLRSALAKLQAALEEPGPVAGPVREA